MATSQGKQVEADDPPSIPHVQEEPQGPANVAPIARPVVQRRRVKDENRGGYECKFIHPPPTYVQTECSVCLLVLRSPHLANCCSHNFCKECSERVQKAGNCCPLCNKENFTLTYNREKDVSLQQFEVYCTHRKMGCEWKGKLEMLDTHLNVNPKLDKQLEGCAFVEVQCFNDGCELYYQRRCIIEHQCRACPLRVFSCEHCHEYESTYHDVTTNHWPACKCYPLPCPHECRQEIIQRQNLEQHLNEECPLLQVECEFKYAGCEAKLPRKDMPDHLRDNVGHMTLLARQNQMLAQQNQELMMKLQEKDEQLQQVMEENRREVAETIACLKEELRTRLAERDEQSGEQQSVTRRELGNLINKQEVTDSSLKKLHGSTAPAAEVAALKNQLGTLAQQNQELMTKLLEKDEQLRTTMEDNRREMEDSITRLTEHQQQDTEELRARLVEKDEQIRELGKQHRKEMDRLEEEKSNEIKELSAEARQITGGLDAIKATLDDRLTAIQQKSDADYAKVVHHVGEAESRRANVISQMEGRVTKLENSKAAAAKVKQLKDHLEEIERRITTTKTEHEKLVQQAVTRTDLNDLVRKQEATDSSLKKLHGSTAHEAEVVKLKQQIGDLASKQVATLKNRLRDVARKQEATDSSLKELQGSVAPAADVATLKKQLSDMAQKQDTVVTFTTIEKLYHHVHIAPVQIVMTNYERHKQDSDEWQSDGFYTHPQGYKVCLAVFANGIGDSKGSNVTSGIYLMRGEFDNHLKWPFRGDVTITLLNQREDKNHRTTIINFSDQTPDRHAARVTSGERGVGWGQPKFIAHGQLGYNPATNCQYLMNDCLYFRVKVELL